MGGLGVRLLGVRSGNLLSTRRAATAACACAVMLFSTGCGPEKADPKNFEIPFDQILSFAAGAGTDRFRRTGWHAPEQAFTWTNGPAATMRFVLPRSDYPIGIRMRLTGLFKAPQLPSQLVRVRANGTKVAEWQVAATADFSFVVPREILHRNGRLDLKLELPSATSPKALGAAEDTRVLAVRCSEIEVSRGVHMPDIWP